MRKFILDSVCNIKPSGIRQFFDLANEIPGCISLGVGEPDFDTPWHIREEGIYSLEKGNTFYTANSGLKELRIAVSNFLNRKYNLNYKPLKEKITVKEEILEKQEREGFTVIEWGGSIIK